ncbi:unnamed protein product [Peronospora belbahrii]|uniref:Uncharacterized protein n=1 Tax=Peronospora belbahrii TaxID=622444 RepID=A0AAU9KX04_9STRA|nr:unnamed protein product [Peronospora belbahrii]
MALKTVVSTLVASSDADLETYFISNQISPLVHLINNYLSRGIALQTRVDCDNNNESHEAVAKTLLVDSGAVFSLFLRLVDAQPQLLQRAMDCGLLHVTRLVPFCQLCGVKNASAVANLSDGLVNNVATFSTTTVMLRQFYIQQLHDLYVKVVQAKRDQVVDLIRSISAAGREGFGYGADTAGPDDVLWCSTMLRDVIADLASACINFSRRDLSSGEKLLAGLHALSNGCLDDDAEHGSFLSDLWYFCEYKE